MTDNARTMEQHQLQPSHLVRIIIAPTKQINVLHSVSAAAAAPASNSRLIFRSYFSFRKEARFISKQSHILWQPSHMPFGNPPD
jgi:hypothetical protein